MRILLLGIVAIGLTCVADDWPRWRGADFSDISKEKNLLKTWPEGGPKRVWLNEDAGLGYAGIAVVKDVIYTMGLRDQTEFLIAIKAADGKELWKAEIGERFENSWGDGPRGTPTVDGEMVYALGAQGVLVAASTKDGKVAWSKKMSEFGGKTPSWGYTESPLVDGDKVVVTPGGDKGAIVALNKKTGATIWQSTEFTDPAQYASLIAFDHNGARQYCQLTMQNIVGVNAKDGKVLWKHPFPGKTAVIPTPIFRNGEVYVSAGYGVGSSKIRLGAGNEITVVFDNKVMKNHHGGVVLFGDHLYGHSDGPGWLCQDWKTGDEVWSERSAIGKGAITIADGQMYLLDEGKGTVVLADATPTGWKERGRFTLEPQTTKRKSRGKIWTHPVISNGKLYLRDQELLFCFDVAAR